MHAALVHTVRYGLALWIRSPPPPSLRSLLVVTWRWFSACDVTWVPFGYLSFFPRLCWRAFAKPRRLEAGVGIDYGEPHLGFML